MNGYGYSIVIATAIFAHLLVAHPTLKKNDEEDDEINPYMNKLVKNRTKEEMENETRVDYWNWNALQAVQDRLFRKLNENTAKNVIFFLGDGMSIPTIAATRVYLGGEEEQLSFEKFPYTALSKTYCVDHQTADSACSATAYLGGVKANLGTIGVSAAVNKRNCTAMNIEENHVNSIARLFQLKGKRTGFVTTTRVTHASPAGELNVVILKNYIENGSPKHNTFDTSTLSTKFKQQLYNVVVRVMGLKKIPRNQSTQFYFLRVYAHTASRNWESDTNVLNAELDPKQCRDIAYQLIFGQTGRNLQVILGGGRKKFLPMEVTDEEGNTGGRSDDLNLIEEWKKQKKEMGAKYEYVWNRKQLLSVKNDTEYLLGLFEPGHMKYNLERSKETEPSLEEMTEVAIRVLQRAPASANSSASPDTGFFLFVEGGRIDTAHHSTFAHKALDETAEFAKAVQTAVQMTNEEDTLIVVTADHAHTMSFSGYAGRGSEIFGYAGQASDSNLYTILNYANGPGYRPLMATGERYVPSEEEMNEVGFKWPSTSPLNSETHGADDVAVFAKGPWAHLFTGTMEENVIPHLIAAAACVSPQIPCANFKKQS